MTGPLTTTYEEFSFNERALSLAELTPRLGDQQLGRSSRIEVWVVDKRALSARDYRRRSEQSGISRSTREDEPQMDPKDNYWTKSRGMAVSRRRFLHGSVVVSVGAATAAILGCGDDDDTQSQGGAPSPTSASPQPSSSAVAAKPVRGGTWRAIQTSEVQSFDALGGVPVNATGKFAAFVYSSLTRLPAGPKYSASNYTAVPDLALSWESADLVDFVIKLNTKAKFHAPVSRALEAEDVVFSYSKAKANKSFSNDIYDSFQAIDKETVRFRLKAPNGLFLTSDRGIVIQPKEAGSLFDPAKKMVGTGPWMFGEYRPGSLVRYVRNPEWHISAEAPYFDAVELSIVPEYANGLTQFLGGNVDEFAVQANDVLRVKSSLKDVQYFRAQPALAGSYISFANNAGDEKQPWQNPLVRQAVSMALNRDDLTEAAYNIKRLKDGGIEVDSGWNNIVPNGTRDYWLDPQGKFHAKASDPGMTPVNMKFFAYNVAEAKKMMEAAGFKDGFKARYHYALKQYGEEYRIVSELVPVYLKAIGIDLELVPEDYSSQYVVKTIRGEHDGLAHHPLGSGNPLISTFDRSYTVGSPRNPGMVNDPYLTRQIASLYATADQEKARIGMIALQNYTTEKMYYVPTQLGGASASVAYQPNLKNVLDYQVNQFNQGNETIPFYWRA